MHLEDMPLPIPAGDTTTLEEHRDRLRGAYSKAISNIVDRCTAELVLPDDQAAICLDVAQFTTFLMAVKIAELRGLTPTREHLMKWYWPMQKALKDEVPGMLRQFADAAAAQGAIQ